MSPPLSPQQSFESVFTLQGPIEPDHKNHITSSFSVLALNNISGNLDIHKPRSKKLLPKHATTTTAAWRHSDVYERNMTCFAFKADDSLGHDLAVSPTSQENCALAEGSVGILGDSRVPNQLPGNSSDPPTSTAKKPPSSIYSHSLLQPIHVPVTRVPENWRSSQHENRYRYVGRPSRRESLA